jgi:hypothetical protein
MNEYGYILKKYIFYTNKCWDIFGPWAILCLLLPKSRSGFKILAFIFKSSFYQSMFKEVKNINKHNKQKQLLWLSRKGEKKTTEYGDISKIFLSWKYPFFHS